VRILAVFVEPDAIRTEVVAVLSRDGPEARVERAWAGESGNVYTLHSQVGVGHLPMSRLKRMPRRVSDYGVSRSAVPMPVGWLLFAVSLGVGVLIGWLIWG